MVLCTVILPVVAVEGVVVLKEVVDCAACCTMRLGFPESTCMVLEWYCPLYGGGVVPGIALEGYGTLYCFCMVLGVVLKWNCFLC